MEFLGMTFQGSLLFPAPAPPPLEKSPFLSSFLGSTTTARSYQLHFFKFFLGKFQCQVGKEWELESLQQPLPLDLCSKPGRQRKIVNIISAQWGRRDESSANEFIVTTFVKDPGV